MKSQTPPIPISTDTASHVSKGSSQPEDENSVVSKQSVPSVTMAPMENMKPVKKSSKKPLFILMSILILMALGGGAYALLKGSKDVPKNTALVRRPAAAADASAVAMMKDYIALWKTNPVKATAYLDLTALKKDSTCAKGCVDTDITVPEKLKYTDPGIVIGAIALEGSDKVKVHLSLLSTNVSTKTTPSSSGGYVYTLVQSGNSFKIIKIKLFID
jgi:flagellar basal body-associated protein FliL